MPFVDNLKPLFLSGFCTARLPIVVWLLMQINRGYQENLTQLMSQS